MNATEGDGGRGRADAPVPECADTRQIVQHNAAATILVVDDVDATRYATVSAIRSAGFEVTEASTGQEALAKASEAPDLVVLVVNLSDMSGFEVCRRLKAGSSTASIPVLQLSATAVEASDQAAGLEYGADGYLTRPVEPVVLLATIRSLLGLRKAEREKEEEARQWDVIFRTLEDAICLLDPDGRILRHNPAFERIASNGAALDGRLCFEALHGGDSFADNCPLVEARKTLKRAERNMRVGEKYFRVTADPVLDESGRLISVVHSMSDITDRQRTLDALADSERRYRSLFERNLAGVFRVAPDGHYLDCNDTCARTLGFSSREELMQHNAAELFADPADMHAAIAAILERKSLFNLELRLKRKDGSIATVLENVNLVEKEYGEPFVIEGTFIDISNANTTILVVDDVEAMRYATVRTLRGEGFRVVEAATGQTALEKARNGVDLVVLDVNLPDMSGFEVCQRLKADRATASLPVVHLSATCVDAKDKSLALQLGADGYLTQPFEPVELVATVRALIRLKQSELVLAQRTLELERSNDELQQFAYVASHDLQEPLRMVTRYLELLCEKCAGTLSPSARDYIGFAVDGARRMQAMVEDLLALSRVGTRGKPFGTVDCNEALGQVLLSLHTAIQANAATVNSDPLPTVMADTTQILQLFQNLIGNAIRFRRASPPQIHISAALRDANWIFYVRDNGIGIEAKDSDRIFVMFQRLHTRDEYPGTGMGLAICKKIVERHGGRIWVESQPGQGSTFCFTLPAAIAKAAAGAAQD